MNSSLHPALLAPPDAARERALRDALGMFATGVTIVTTLAADGTPAGLTVNSFNSVSLAPPLVLWSLAHQSTLRPAFAAARHYAIHVLAAGQRELAVRFATRGVDRWASVAWRPGVTGAPVIAGAAAVFECAGRSQYVEGDHTILVGEVRHCEHQAGSAPLLYHGGVFHTEHPLGSPAAGTPARP